MKPLILAVLWTLLNQPPDTLLIVDRDLKKPVRHAGSFTTELYLKRNFPVYAAETEQLVAEIDKVVKRLDEATPCDGFEKAGTAHTSIRVETHCDETRIFRVTLVTQLDATNTSFSFALIPAEPEAQHVQRRLLDFASYISR